MPPLARPAVATTLAAGLVAALLVPASAAAIGTVSDGAVTFGYANDFSSGFRDTVDTVFTGAAPGDQAYESWWFFRVSGDSRESAFGAPDAESYLGSVGQLDWSDPGGAGAFGARLGFEVIDPGGGGGNLFQNMRIENLGAGTLVLDVFHYTDLDVGGSFGGDSAVLDGIPGAIAMTVTDGADSAPIVAYGADAFQVDRWNRLLRDLTDNNTDDLDGSGLPFSNDDFTVAFQWSLTLGVGESESMLTQFASNAPLLPRTATIVPEPSQGFLLLIGLVGLSWAGRPRPT